MQFLSDVYLRCPDCDGKRYRAEVLEVKLEDRSIADVLDLTVGEARAFFAGDAEIDAALQPLADVGLDYLRLGQPVPTLSGGEAQRLKLAAYLVGAAGNAAKGKLFLFDEPTTGLHFADVARLLGALRKLIDAGHSLLVIEHNLDLIRAADWIIDLGPEGGDAGGEVVVAGTVADVIACAGVAHRHCAEERTSRVHSRRPQRNGACEPRVAALPRREAIRVHNAREHNLKSIDVEIPRDRFTVVTGVSGSGKSTLAFDIVFAEGQRRYLESLNAYARQFVQPASRPDVDAIFGIPPTVAIEQRTSRGGRKSTVATLTEIYHFLRLLYVKLGVQHCPDDGTPIAPQSEDGLAAQHPARLSAGGASRCSRRWWSRARAITPISPSGPRGRALRHCAWTARCFLPIAGRGSTASRSTRSSCRWPNLSSARATNRRCAKGLARALEHGKGVVHVLGPRNEWCGRVLDQTRVSHVQPQLSGARPASVLVQFEARLVPGLLRRQVLRSKASTPSKR